MMDAPKRLTTLRETTQVPLYQNIVPYRSEKCPKIVRFSIRQYIRDNFDIVSLLESLGITVLHIGQKYHNSHNLIVVIFSALPYITDQFILEDVNPIQSTGYERHRLGNIEARIMAQRRFLKNTLSAIFYIDARGPALYYRDIAKKIGFLARLEALIFRVDFEVKLSVSLGGIAR